MFDKIRKIVTIACFFCIITIPLFSFQKPGRSSMVQNKVTATLPDFSEHSLFERNTLTQIEQVVDENIGCKDPATLLYIGANFRLFDNLAISGYERGEGEHFLYLPKNSLNNYQGLCQPTEETYAVLTQQLETIDKLVTQLGGKFLFMPIPNKEAVYPEVVPDYIVGSGDNGIFASLTDYIETHSSITLVPTKRYLTDYRQLLNDTDDVLYYNNSDVTHWNGYGMYVGYQALMATLRAQDPNIEKFEDEEIVIDRQKAPCALSWLQSSQVIQYCFHNLTDYTYHIAPKAGWSYNQDNTEPAGFLLANDSQDRYFRFTNAQAKNHKTILIYGDSYIYSFMLPLLAETFSEVYFINANNCGATEISDLLRYITPDLFLLERVERQVDLQRPDYCLEQVEAALKTQIYVAAMDHPEDKPIIVHFDNPNIEATHIINVSEQTSNGTVRISGWAADLNKKVAPLAMMVQLGEQTLLGVPIDRPDLPQEYYHGGFYVDIPTAFLEGVSELKLYAITLDGTATYQPLSVQIQH